jgi:hypothetical protein
VIFALGQPLLHGEVVARDPVDEGPDGEVAAISRSEKPFTVT